jgi:hypothetical protein
MARTNPQIAPVAKLARAAMMASIEGRLKLALVVVPVVSMPVT